MNTLENGIIVENVRKLNGKTPIASITLDWSESRKEFQNCKFNGCYLSFTNFDRVINKIASYETGNIGYCKAQYTVRWLDGSEYVGRLEITEKDLFKSNFIGNEITAEYEFQVGLRKPSSWTRQQYDDYIKEYCKLENIEVLEKFVNDYQIFDLTESELKELEAYHLELQERSYNLTQSKPTIEDSTQYEAVTAICEGMIGEFKVSMNGLELKEAIRKNEIVQILIPITPAETKVIEVTEKVNNTESNDIYYKLNDEKNGVEIYFNDIPCEETRILLKSNGFKWSRYNKCWYAKQSENTLKVASDLCNNEVKELPLAEIELAEFVDIAQFNISEETERRLIDNSLFGDMREIGIETKRLQGTLRQLLDDTKQVITLTDNNYYKNRLVEGFNGFCERYTREQNNYLYQKSINPSWAVTGRGGLNISRYNKKQDQLYNKMVQLVEMLDKQKSVLKKYKGKFEREEKQKQLAEVKFTISKLNNSVEVKTSKREFIYSGYKYNTRSYETENHFMMKLCACYRIFEKSSGKEVHSMKTTDKLPASKDYLMYLESQLQAV